MSATTPTSVVISGNATRGKRGRSPLKLWKPLPLKAKVGVTILTIFIVIAIIGPAVAPFNPSATIVGQNLPTSPSVTHLLGTTATGQDVLSQILAGTRVTVVIGLATGVIATVLAIAMGMTAGYIGGWIDEVLSLITNVFLVMPALPLLVVMLGYMPHAGSVVTAIVLSILGWAWGARVIRAQTLTVANRDYVAASREVGERTWRIILFEILPNEVGLIAASFVGTVLYAILTSVALSFLGVSSTTQWSYGTIFFWAQSGNAVQLGAWWWYVFPGICVALLGMSLVLINFGLDEFSNPRLRATRKDRRIQRRAWRPADPTPVVRDFGEAQV